MNKRDDTPDEYRPHFGFTSGRLARIARGDGDQLTLVVGNLATTDVFNTLRTTEKSRAGRVIKEHALGNLRHIVECAAAIPTDRVAIVISYSSRDFADEYGLARAESVAIVASMKDCSAFLERKISQEEFIQKSKVHLHDKNGTVKLVEVELD